MRLRRIILRNFRSYRREIAIEIGELTAFIGKNDAGKSSILEALAIFFEDDSVKIEPADASIQGNDRDVLIGCVFDELPQNVVIDTTNKTTLRDEYLLNSDGELEIHKIFNCSVRGTPKFQLFANAVHPTTEGYDNLLNLTITDLKTKWNELNVVDEDVKQNRSASIRHGIWRECVDLNLDQQLISLDDADGKRIWNSLRGSLPVFGLFRADRPSRDEDAEVQDPMKLAVRDALVELSDDLDAIQETVQAKVLDVANRTVDKIKEMSPDLADSLMPQFKATPKWDSIFKLSLNADDDIPVNKRGSGVRRLILMNFFRAEVERKQQDTSSPGVIYAIEEPETSQHPDHQIMLIEALKELAGTDNCQVLISTHVPGLAGSIPVEDFRYIDQESDGNQRIRSGDEQVYEEICAALGVLPETRNGQVQLFVCVEGPTDVNFIHTVSELLNQHDSKIPRIENDPRVIVFPLGGSSLKSWATHHYLRQMNVPEFHIYDRDDENPPRYQVDCNRINARSDGSWATLTKRREIENYYHPDIIQDIFGVTVSPSDTDDVAQLISVALKSNQNKRRNKDKVKKKLNELGPPKMRIRHLLGVDKDNEIQGWFTDITNKLK